MTSEATRKIYSAERAQAYDRRIRATIPGYEALHQLACMIAAETTGGQGRVLVVGAGTGGECLALAQACPDMRIVGVDPATDMIGQAQAKIDAHGLGTRIHLYSCLLARMPETEPFDAATLLLVLHFLPDDGAKLSLLRDVAARLRPGAPLILADLFGPAWADPWQAELRTFWRLLQRSAGIAEDAIAKGFAHVDRDIHPIGQPRLAALLAEAGFSPPQPFFQALCFGGWIARRRHP